jgi:hypothetical protein
MEGRGRLQWCPGGSIDQWAQPDSHKVEEELDPDLHKWKAGSGSEVK